MPTIDQYKKLYENAFGKIDEGASAGTDRFDDYIVKEFSDAEVLLLGIEKSVDEWLKALEGPQGIKDPTATKEEIIWCKSRIKDLKNIATQNLTLKKQIIALAKKAAYKKA